MQGRWGRAPCPRLHSEQHSEPERSRNENPYAVSESEEEYWAQFPDTLTTEHVAKIIRTGVQAVRSRLRDGTIPGHRVADSWIIFKAEIRAWLPSTTNRPKPIEPVDVLAGYPDELSYRDLMTLFGKTKQTVYVWLEQGHVPGSLVAGRWTIYKWQLHELLHETSNKSASTESKTAE